MKIKEVCERTGLTRRAVRFYEEKGLISPEIREENEYRDYTETDVCRLQHVARLRGYVGLSNKLDSELGRRAVV